MRRKIVFLIIMVLFSAAAFVVVVFAKVGQADEEGITEMTLNYPSSTESQIPVSNSTEVKTDPVITESTLPEGIPVYVQEDLLAATDLFVLNRHSSYYTISDSDNRILVEQLFARYPSAAVKLQETGRSYAIYDTDQGNRLYLFLEEYNNGFSVCCSGFPVLISKELSYAEFEHLKPHSSTLADVAEIDPAAAVYTTLLTDDFLEEMLQGCANGHSCSTIHYLTDGILWIQYDIVAGSTPETMTICDWSYSPDYEIQFSDQEKQVYRIAPQDLPYGEEGMPIINTGSVLFTADFSSVQARDTYDRAIYPQKISAGLLQTNSNFAQTFAEAAQKTGPLEISNLDNFEMLSYMKSDIIPGLKLGTIGTGDLREQIPVYKEEALIFQEGQGGIWFEDYAIRQNIHGNAPAVYTILRKYPTSAIRKNGDVVYLLYDTDTGYRICVYLEAATCLRLDQFPVIIGEKLCLKDFASLKPGDPFSKVEEIDPGAGVQMGSICTSWFDVAIDEYYKLGFPLATVHYLEDGLLRIEYDMQKDGGLTIAQIEFHDDYMMENAFGVEQSYKLDDRDLPWYERNK